MRSGLVALGLLAGIAAPALAEGTTVFDLGEMPSRETCMQKANKIMGSYMTRNGGFSIDTTEWIVYGWDFGPGDQDVTIMCPIFRDEFVNALMTVHGETTDEERMFTAEELERIWQQ